LYCAATSLRSFGSSAIAVDASMDSANAAKASNLFIVIPCYKYQAKIRNARLPPDQFECSVIEFFCPYPAVVTLLVRSHLLRRDASNGAGNFMRSVPITLLLNLVLYQQSNLDMDGILYAMASGALASGVGYAIWYTVLPALKNTSAASVQLSVPVIAAVGGVIFLAEPITLRLLLTSTAILGGIALVIVKK